MAQGGYSIYIQAYRHRPSFYHIRTTFHIEVINLLEARGYCLPRLGLIPLMAAIEWLGFNIPDQLVLNLSWHSINHQDSNP